MAKKKTFFGRLFQKPAKLILPAAAIAMAPATGGASLKFLPQASQPLMNQLQSGKGSNSDGFDGFDGGSYGTNYDMFSPFVAQGGQNAGLMNAIAQILPIILNKSGVDTPRSFNFPGIGQMDIGGLSDQAGIAALINELSKSRNTQQSFFNQINDIVQNETSLAPRIREEITKATALTPDELARESSTFALEKRQLPELERRAGLPGETLYSQTGPISAEIAQRIANDLSQTAQYQYQPLSIPETSQYNYQEIPYEDIQTILQTGLQRLPEQVAQQYGSRGLLGSGLQTEALGRGAIDLAAQNASLRQQLRVQNEQRRQNIFEMNQALGQVHRQELAQEEARKSAIFQYNQHLKESALLHAAGYSDTARSISDQARNELHQFLANQESLSQASTNRAAQGAISAETLAQQPLTRAIEAQTRVASAGSEAETARQKTLMEGLIQAQYGATIPKMNLPITPNYFSQPFYQSPRFNRGTFNIPKILMTRNYPSYGGGVIY